MSDGEQVSEGPPGSAVADAGIRATLPPVRQALRGIAFDVALPPLDQVLRGIALSGLAALLAMTAVGLVRRAGLLASPLATLGGLGSFLSAWAALIHLTGGERFDDHPFL